MAPRTNSRLRQVLKKVQKPQTGWLDLFPAVIGKSDGTILTGTNGLIHVRNILNGQDLTVYNFVVPNRFGLQVEAGRRVDQLGLWQVKGALETFDSPAGGISVPYHAEQHQFPNGDTVFINRKQMLVFDVLVKDAANFIVKVYGGTTRTPAGALTVKNQLVDLSSYVPATGAIYVSIETDNDGILSVHAGTGFAAPAIGNASLYPVPDAGKTWIAIILLFTEMDALKDEHIIIPVPLATDYSGLGGGTQIHDAGEETELADDDEFGFWQATSELLKKITWANIVIALTAIFDTLYAAIGHTHAADGSGEIVMEDGVTFPPVPVETEDGTDWVYSD